jgi:hypothetical protein
MRCAIYARKHALFLVICLVFTATVSAKSSDQTVTGMESGVWLRAYDNPEPEWHTMAESWVHGFWNGATMFGGIQCPQQLSSRTLAATTADVIKQRKKPTEDVAFAVIVAAYQQGCSVDTNAMHRAADLLEKKWETK